MADYGCQAAFAAQNLHDGPTAAADTIVGNLTMATALTVPRSLATPVAGRTFRCVGCETTGRARRPFVVVRDGPRPMRLYRCAACRLVQLHPRYTADELRRLYAGDYYVFAESESHRWARAVQQYAVHLLPLETPVRRRLLDVGCALGHMCALAAARGWRTCGVDVSAEAVSRASRTLGVEARAGTLAQYRGTWPPFDAVFLGDVIEHAADPRALLREVRGVLAPGGVVCIDTPNAGGRWRAIGRSRWVGYNRFHINLFDAASLTSLLRACGFPHVQIGGYTHYRYGAWPDRPEVAAIVGLLPRALAWRVSALLRRLCRDDGWGRLRHERPASLDAALKCLGEHAGALPPANDVRGDNLSASARC